MIHDLRGERPLVSILLAVRNEEIHIERTLKQVFQQDYPVDRIEVIVVDGCSNDRTPEIVESFVDSGRKPKLLRLQEQGRSQGLNAGIRIARGDIVVRVDARTSIEVDYVSRCVET